MTFFVLLIRKCSASETIDMDVPGAPSPGGFNYASSLPAASLSQYNEKLEILNMDFPYRLPADKWCTDPTKWPNITLWELQDYLRKHPGQLCNIKRMLQIAFSFVDVAS